MEKFFFFFKESEVYYFEGWVFISVCCGLDVMLVVGIRIGAI